MYEYSATVTKVIDGDTVDVVVDLGLRVSTQARLRLLGLNAPEHDTATGKAALIFLTGLLPVGTAVVIRTQKDKTEKYGRWLAQIMLGTQDINQTMVDKGYALSWDGKGQRPVA